MSTGKVSKVAPKKVAPKKEEEKLEKLRDFMDLYNLDISKEVSLKPTFYRDQNKKLQKNPEDKWLKYLEWATILKLLYQNGAKKVRYGSHCNEDGYPAFYNKNGLKPFVKVWVNIDGDEFSMEFPVINGNSCYDDPNQLGIHIAQQRAFAKCVAINTGLGLKLWEKEEEELPNAKEEQEGESDKEKAKKLKEKITEGCADLVKILGDRDAVFVLLDTSADDMSSLFKSNDLGKLEELSALVELRKIVATKEKGGKGDK